MGKPQPWTSQRKWESELSSIIEFSLTFFKFSNGHVIQCGVSAVAIIETFDVLKDSHFCLLVISIGCFIDFFCLDAFEETFGYGIVPAISFAAHTADHQRMAVEQSGKLITGILHTAIGMKDQCPAYWSVACCHIPGGQYCYVRGQTATD